MPTLHDLAPARPARLVRIGGDRAFRLRLMELGFLPGTTVEVLRHAPLGGVLEVLVRRCRIALRSEQARAIEVAAAEAGS